MLTKACAGNSSAENSNMHILMIFGRRLAVGGHYRSGLSFARALLRRGHRVSVLFPSALPGLAAAWETSGIETIIAHKTAVPSAPPGGRMPFASLRHLRLIAALHGRAPIDVIHCQDEGALREGLWAATLLRLRIVCTRAGGEMKISLVPPTMDFVLYSQELKDAYLQSGQPFRPELLHVIPARFDLPPPSDDPRPSWPMALNCRDSGAMHLFMAMRLKPDKMPWIESLERLMASAARAQVKLHFVLAGDGPPRERIEACAAACNQPGSSVRLHLLGAVKDETVLQACYQAADAVIGHARGIIEGMAAGKPAMVMGEHGELEWVTPERVDVIAYYNYSGRHFRDATHSETTNLKNVLELLSAPQALSELGQWSARHVRHSLDVETGVESLLNVYDKAMTHQPSIGSLASWEWRRVKLIKHMRAEETSTAMRIAQGKKIQQ